MGRFVEGYNLLPDGRHVWLVQATQDEEGGWNWNEFLPYDSAEGLYRWGGDEWITSVPSMKRVREEFAKGDLVVCYQAEPKQAIVGLARVASSGYADGRGKRRTGGTNFDLDWGCLVDPVPFAAVRADRILSKMEKARFSQGTVFRLSPAEFNRVLALTTPVGASVGDVEDALNIVWPDSDEPTANDAELERRVRAALKKGPVPRPAGQKKPKSATRDGVVVYERDPKVKAWVLQQASGKCELCTGAAPFVNGDGQPFLETHHVRPLARGGSDTTGNTVALCPNCHRRLHHAGDADKQVERLYTQVGRLVRE